MVNFKKLASRAQKAKDAMDKQGGSDVLKEKANRIKGVAKGPGSVGDRAKAAAQVAREKPNPASDVAGDSAQGPIGGGDAPPPVSERPAPTPAAAADAPKPDPDAPAGR